MSQEGERRGERRWLTAETQSVDSRCSVTEATDDAEREREDGSVETAPLIKTTSSPSDSSLIKNTGHLFLLLGVFLANSDNAVLLAIFRQIADEFDEFESASWIINSYLIGVLLTQPLWGKLSDIFGRKPLLIAAYCCYCLGGLLGGLGFAWWTILLGRAVTGIGNAGITVLVSTLIVDLVPAQDVAIWRSYVYAVNQLGRAVGPSLGGLITQFASWRWALLYQVPLHVLSLAFITWKMALPMPPPPPEDEVHQNHHSATWLKLRRIDFLGSGTLAIANVSMLLFLDQIQGDLDSIHRPTSIVTLILWTVFLMAFLGAEGFVAREPILPLSLLAQANVISSYAIQFFQTAAQMALFTSVPLYFRITVSDSSLGVAGRLLFITVGTIIGGLVSGWFIKRTGKYRLIIWASILLSDAFFLLIFIRWRGSTSWAETMYGLPIGFGFGVSLSAAFIGLTAGLDHDLTAVSTSGFYLSLNIGSLAGVTGASLFITAGTKITLHKSLKGVPNASEIIRDVTHNLGKLDRLRGNVRKLVVDAFIGSIVNTWLLALISGLLALVASFIMQPYSLQRPKGKQTRPKSYSTFTEPRDESER